MLCEEKTTETHYDMLHPTWVATQALRDRNFELARPGNQKWEEKMRKIIRAAQFDTVEYKIKYPPLGLGRGRKPRRKPGEDGKEAKGAKKDARPASEERRARREPCKPRDPRARREHTKAKVGPRPGRSVQADESRPSTRELEAGPEESADDVMETPVVVEEPTATSEAAETEASPEDCNHETNPPRICG